MVFFLVFVVLSWSFCCPEAHRVPAIYMFGDSLFDVGNNNYIADSLAKANFPPYGLDFLTQEPTGRVSNGKNTADFLAEKVKLPTSPPYLSLKSSKNKTSVFLTGVSFASSGSGIFSSKNPLTGRVIQLSKQVKYYSIVHRHLVQKLGSIRAEQHFSKSLFIFSIGANDIKSPNRGNTSTPRYVDLMTSTLKRQLKRLHTYGARKFVFVGLLQFGCIPAERITTQTEECNKQTNDLADKWNQGLKSMLQELQSEFKDTMYSYFDAYGVMHNMLENPAAYGIKEVKAACCGSGKLKARCHCSPVTAYCSNRNSHFFWDPYHPSETVVRVFVDLIYDGPSQYTYPMNMKNLINV